MMALASVDLPEPLGPIRAWISPSRTVRSTPLRICLSLGLDVEVADLEIRHADRFRWFRRS